MSVQLAVEMAKTMAAANAAYVEKISMFKIFISPPSCEFFLN